MPVQKGTGTAEEGQNLRFAHRTVVYRGAVANLRAALAVYYGVTHRSVPFLLTFPGFRTFPMTLEYQAMRDQTCYRSRLVLAALSAAATLFVFGATPVRAQTAPEAAATATVQFQGPVRRLSIDEAVALALEQNVDLQVDRFEPQVQDYSISIARSGWTPVLFSSLQTRNQTNPPQDIFGGAETITDERLNSQVGVQQLLPFGGASYSASWNSGRVTTNNVFSSFNPQLNSQVAFNYTQPLLRNFTIDATRQQVLVSRKNREISEVQLQQSIAITTRNVKNAYWDLVYANNNLAVQRQSLELAQRSSATTGLASRSGPWRRSTSYKPKPKLRSAKRASSWPKPQSRGLKIGCARSSPIPSTSPSSGTRDSSRPTRPRSSR